MPAAPDAERRTPANPTDARALSRDCARFLLRFADHVDTVWGLAYEPNATGERDGGRSSEHRDISGVGDARVRDALRVIARAELLLIAEIEKVMNHLNSGPGPDHELRGSLISKAEFGKTLKLQRRRIENGDSPRPLVAQPTRPGKGNR